MPFYATLSLLTDLQHKLNNLFNMNKNYLFNPVKDLFYLKKQNLKPSANLKIRSKVIDD